MLDDFIEVIEESPGFVIGIILFIILFSVGGNMAYRQLVPPAPIIIMNATPTPSIVITPAPTLTPTPAPTLTPTLKAVAETLTDPENIPGATFTRAATDPAGVYYGMYYGERAVYIKIEEYLNAGGKVRQVAGDLEGLTIHTRFGLNVNSRYDPAKNQINSLLAEPFKLYLEYERRGII